MKITAKYYCNIYTKFNDFFKENRVIYLTWGACHCEDTLNR